MSNLDSISFYGDPTLSDIAEKNVSMFLSHGFLELGAFQNVGSGKLGVEGQDLSLLRPVFATGVSNYRVWRSVPHQWVWESNVTLKYPGGSQPFTPSGIYFNGTYVPTGSLVSGTGYYIDLNRGQVVFSNPVPSTSVIQVPHANRAIQIYPMDSNEFRFIETDWRLANTSGIYDSSAKAYLPAIFLEVRSLNTLKGTELGSRGKLARAELNFEIFAENAYELKKLIDILYFLETKSFPFFNLENSPRPLNYRGELVNTAATWPIITAQYPYGNARFMEDAITFKVPNQGAPFFRGRVRIGLEFDVYPG